MAMRRGTIRMEFISIDDTVIGVRLGSDFCAEHECGIQPLRDAFGINMRRLGFEGQLVTRVPDTLTYHEYKGGAVLAYSPYPSDVTHIGELVKTELRIYDRGQVKGEDDEEFRTRSNLATAWDGKSFGIHVRAPFRPALKELYEAFQERKATIGAGAPKLAAFENNSLLALGYRKIPEEWLVGARQIDREHRSTQANYRRLEKQSGVFPLLKRAGLGYHALSIMRTDEEGQHFWWLNPHEQHKYRSGWVTTEDLKEWAEGKGPIVKDAK